jgi:hypothetical protein
MSLCRLSFDRVTVFRSNTLAVTRFKVDKARSSIGRQSRGLRWLNVINRGVTRRTTIRNVDPLSPKIPAADVYPTHHLFIATRARAQADLLSLGTAFASSSSSMRANLGGATSQGCGEFSCRVPCQTSPAKGLH